MSLDVRPSRDNIAKWMHNLSNYEKKNGKCCPCEEVSSIVNISSFLKAATFKPVSWIDSHESGLHKKLHIRMRMNEEHSWPWTSSMIQQPPQKWIKIGNSAQKLEIFTIFYYDRSALSVLPSVFFLVATSITQPFQSLQFRTTGLQSLPCILTTYADQFTRNQLPYPRGSLDYYICLTEIALYSG